MSTKVFEVYGEIGVKGDDDVKKRLRGTEDQAEKSAKGLSGAWAKAGSALGITGIVSFLYDATQAASDLSEETSKNETVFGEMSDAVLEFATTSAGALGISERAALSATGTFGNLLRSVGLSEEMAGDMSVTMVQLAADLASFNNATPEEALEALRSGLVGETEPLKKFGVNLNETTLKEEAMRLGLIETTSGVLPSAIKAQASYSLILEQTALAQGDFAKTSDGLANQQRIMAAEFDDAKVALGENLLPVMLEAAGAAVDLLEAFNNMPEPLQKTALGITAVGVAALIASPYLGAFKSGIGGAATAVKGFATGLGYVIPNLTTGIGTIASAGPAVASASAAAVVAAGAVGFGIGSLINEIDAVADAQENLGESIAGQDEEFNAFERWIYGLGDAVEDTTATEREAMAVAEERIPVTDRLTAAIEGQTEAQDAATGANISAEEAELKMLRSDERLAKAKENLRDIQKEFPNDADKIRIATLEVSEAQRGLNTDTEAYEDAAETAAEARKIVEDNKATIAALEAEKVAWQKLMTAISDGLRAEADARSYSTPKPTPSPPSHRGYVRPRHGGGGIQTSGMYSLLAGEHVLSESQVERVTQGAAASTQIIIIADPRYTDATKIKQDFNDLSSAERVVGGIVSQLNGGRG